MFAGPSGKESLALQARSRAIAFPGNDLQPTQYVLRSGERQTEPFHPSLCQAGRTARCVDISKCLDWCDVLVANKRLQTAPITFTMGIAIYLSACFSQ
jgi:hypothetical protein